MSPPATLAAERVEVTGMVQGVGYRPFVYRIAHELGLVGRVGNDSSRVFIDVAGPVDRLEEFARRLRADAPPLALVEHVMRTSVDRSAVGAAGFTIVQSRTADGERTLVAPDAAVCADCLAEMRDPADRRFGHPFITCTNCGPRFTIVRDLPYDRPATTMASFAMCAACAAEYGDPADRRYHAQPIACHDCGPRLSFRRWGRPPTDGFGDTVDVIRSGGTVAIKGLGGFHLACDATDEQAVAVLRDRKARPDKPFAVMVPHLAAARLLAHIDPAEAEQLTSVASPIVLVRARADTPLADAVAPSNPLIGVMLASTPVHHLLFETGGCGPLVMTSANVGGEPITYRDRDVERLADLSDALLTHDRPIHVPCDDSVVRVVGDRLLPIRRARGYAPIPVSVPAGTGQVLAVGGELKNTFCVTSGEHAWVSQHIGDMENLATLDAFGATVDLFNTMYDIAPDVVAVDAHPGYLSSRWARERHGDRLLEVQHHHAHVAAVIAEHADRVGDGPVIGFAFDGTGFGDDGAIWGGEVLVVHAGGFERVAHLANVPLPGGDAAVRHPNRVALAHLWAAGIEWADWLPPLEPLDDLERNLLRRQLETGVNCVPTSSMGRLFDAVASLIGLRHEISYEAQAAIELEFAAAAAGPGIGAYRFEADGAVIETGDVMRSIVGDLVAGRPAPDIARGFHLGVADLVLHLADVQREVTGLTTVALSGGVFQNALLTALCVERLDRAGFVTLTHHAVPPNDGGLALGQAWIASQWLSTRYSSKEATPCA